MARTMFWVAAFCFGLVISGALELENKPPPGFYPPYPEEVPGFDPPHPEEVPGLFEGDIVLDGFDPYNAVGNPKRRWPSKQIPISINPYFDKYEVEVFVKCMHEIEEQTRVDGEDCITFINRTNEVGYIYITAGFGCSSQVGYTGRKQSMSLGESCRFKGTVLHEMLHNLGFYHEQNRPDRDAYVKIIKENIKKGHTRNFLKMEPPEISLNGLPYDYNSLTHYGPYSFAIDPKKPTIVPLQKGVVIGQRKGMSQIDIKQIQRLFGCKERKLIKAQTPGQVTPNCTFDSDLCGWAHVEIAAPLKPNVWTRWSGESENFRTGPIVDHTFKSIEGYYIYINGFHNYHSVAKIQSPAFGPGNYCLTFWYHMHGKDMGSLFVNLVKNGMAWKLRGLVGEQGNEWKQMKVHFPAPAGGKIEFEGIIGSMYRSDMAIDDVLLRSGEC